MYSKNLKNVEVIKVVRIVTLEGEGISEKPYREVYWYFDDKGDLLFRYDSWEDRNRKVGIDD